MPTSGEFTELINNTNRSWTTESGVKGWKCANKSDATKYIFLPAAGCRSGTSLEYADSNGYYWSSSLRTSSPNYGYYLAFSTSQCVTDYESRWHGYPVRPVFQPQN